MIGELISERVELLGVRPATFRLRWKAVGSYDLYRGSRKLGTARVEENRDWTAQFEKDGEGWSATAGSAEDLLRLVGVFVLASEARDIPPAETEAPKEKVSAAERKLSAEWKALQEKRRTARLDALIKEARRRIISIRR